MLYELNTKFTKLEESKGMLENKSIHSTIELVVTDEVPEKDTGIELQPKEKIQFSLEYGKYLYARCSDMNHSRANLAVVNFNVPAAEGSVAGEEILWHGLCGSADETRVNFNIELNSSLENYRKIGVKFYGISVANLRAYAYREFYVDQLTECIKNATGFLGASWGFYPNRDLMTIRETSSMDVLEFEVAYLYVTEIIGIK